MKALGSSGGFVRRFLLILTIQLASHIAIAQAQDSPSRSNAREKIIIDTDIGDDIDDAFAIALALRSPEIQILGVTTCFGDTEARAKIADRFLGESGRPDIPVFSGPPTHTTNVMNQKRYGDYTRFAKVSHSNAVDFLLEQIRRYPGEITLVAIGPLTNIGPLLDKDAETFRKLKRVVMMGGSIEHGYGGIYSTNPPPPQPEWNILNGIRSAQKLFESGVPLYVMPLDSTQLKFDEVKREYLFSHTNPQTDSLVILYHLWGQQTPTLFDAMTIAYIAKPDLCPTQPMHIRVDEKGMTIPEPGKPNAQVCLHSDPEAFFGFYLSRLASRD